MVIELATYNNKTKLEIYFLKLFEVIWGHRNAAYSESTLALFLEV
jgi:hypothetical protein